VAKVVGVVGVVGVGVDIGVVDVGVILVLLALLL
jgi:hypothetical protein